MICPRFRFSLVGLVAATIAVAVVLELLELLRIRSIQAVFVTMFAAVAVMLCRQRALTMCCQGSITGVVTAMIGLLCCSVFAGPDRLVDVTTGQSVALTVGLEFGAGFTVGCVVCLTQVVLRVDWSTERKTHEEVRPRQDSSETQGKRPE